MKAKLHVCESTLLKVENTLQRETLLVPTAPKQQTLSATQTPNPKKNLAPRPCTLGGTVNDTSSPPLRLTLPHSVGQLGPDEGQQARFGHSVRTNVQILHLFPNLHLEASLQARCLPQTSQLCKVTYQWVDALLDALLRGFQCSVSPLNQV